MLKLVLQDLGCSAENKSPAKVDYGARRSGTHSNGH